MRKYLCILLALMGVGLVACTVTGVNELVKQQEVATIVATRILLSPTILPLPSSVPTRLATATSTPMPTIADMPEIVPSAAASETISASPGLVPILVATMEPDPFLFSVPENVWWSEDSQILYYQDIETQEAWAYDLSTGMSTSNTYTPRSLRDLEPQIQAELPQNASIMSVSPKHDFVLYRLPLPEPILIPEDPSLSPTPEFKLPDHYTAELWLQKEGQDFNLGLVDNCFGLLAPPLWSTNENVAIVNTAGSPDIACLHPVWLIDLETLSIGPLDAPWTENYRVLDLSANGDEFLVRSYTERLNYLYNATTNGQWIIPIDDTDRMTLIEAEPYSHCLVFELEFSEKILRDHVWHCNPTTGEINFLSTFEGQISQGIVSPDKKFIAFTVVNDFPQGNFYENITPGIWLLALP